MKTFSPRTREMMLRVSNGKCQCSFECVKQVTEFHHKLPNTKVNQKLFPLFLQSPFNCLPINNDCHMSKPKIKVSESEATVFEEFLKDLIKGDA